MLFRSYKTKWKLNKRINPSKLKLVRKFKRRKSKLRKRKLLKNLKTLST